MTRLACSPKHKHCNSWHRWCIEEYRTARLAVLAQNVPSEWVGPIVVAAYAVGGAQVIAYTHTTRKRGERS